MHHAYPAQGPVEAAINLQMAELVITADDVDEITVDVAPTQADRAADVRSAENTEVSFADGRLSIVQRRENLISTWVNKGWFIDVHVRVPRRSRLDVRSAYGNIRVLGLIGPSTLVTAYGDIAAGDVAELEAKTSHGEIAVERASGTSRLSASSVRVGEVYGDTTAKASHGNVSLGMVMGEAQAVSGYGNIDVRTLMGRLQARSAHGRIRIDDAVHGAAGLDVGYGDIEVGIREGSLTWLDLDSKQGAVRNELQPSTASRDGAAQTVGEDPGDAESDDRLEIVARTTYGSVRAYRAAVL
ncbi:DUF4097 family beta strand repeat-containing protein [Zhihengliuella alba]|uniref:DUF4097 family beta strand repeat-containing protein n=1 Tax=Zhihengliuella alba TaxID=547018 RepID=A0ABP7DU76_9MICC